MQTSPAHYLHFRFTEVVVVMTVVFLRTYTSYKCKNKLHKCTLKYIGEGEEKALFL